MLTSGTQRLLCIICPRISSCCVQGRWLASVELLKDSAPTTSDTLSTLVCSLAAEAYAVDLTPENSLLASEVGKAALKDPQSLESFNTLPFFAPSWTSFTC